LATHRLRRRVPDKVDGRAPGRGHGQREKVKK